MITVLVFFSSTQYRTALTRAIWFKSMLRRYLSLSSARLNHTTLNVIGTPFVIISSSADFRFGDNMHPSIVNNRRIWDLYGLQRRSWFLFFVSVDLWLTYNYLKNRFHLCRILSIHLEHWYTRLSVLRHRWCHVSRPASVSDKCFLEKRNSDKPYQLKHTWVTAPEAIMWSTLRVFGYEQLWLSIVRIYLTFVERWRTWNSECASSVSWEKDVTTGTVSWASPFTPRARCSQSVSTFPGYAKKYFRFHLLLLSFLKLSMYLTTPFLFDAFYLVILLFFNDTGFSNNHVSLILCASRLPR